MFFTQIKGMSTAEMFYVSALIQTGLMAGNFVAFKSGLSKKVSYTKLLGLKGVVLLIMLFFPSWYAVGFLVIYEFMESVMRVKYNDFLNHTVKNSADASSMRSLSLFISGLGKSIGMATMGIIASWFGVNGLWAFAAIVLILLALSRVKGLPRFTRNDKVRV